MVKIADLKKVLLCGTVMAVLVAVHFRGKYDPPFVYIGERLTSVLGDARKRCNGSFRHRRDW